MKVYFSLEYFILPKQELKVLITGQQDTPLAMQYDVNGLWQAEFETDLKSFEYSYALYENGEIIRTEYPYPKRKAVLNQNETFLKDCWRDIPPLSFLYTSAFKKDFQQNQALPVYNKTLIIKAYAPQLCEGQTLKICGLGDTLGNWDIQQAKTMTNTALNEWSIALNAQGLNFPLEFKFITKKDGQILWQSGPNNTLNCGIKEGETLIQNNFYPLFDIKNPKAAGIVLPVFSLRSESSFGVGDFGDLKKLADWAEQAGQKFIQILPINDTTITGTWTDSYPYNSISIYAFHPMYMDLNDLGPLKDTHKEEWFKWERKRINSYPQIHYEEVNLLKRAYIKMAFFEQYKQTFACAEFKEFFENNKHWLKPYAAFRFLRDKYNTPDFTKWPQHSVYSQQFVEELTAPQSADYKEISFFYFTQYHLHRQLLKACNYARSKGIKVKGDIPIGISRSSVEAWAEPYYFNMNTQAGAPPDDFSADGQNWGFPTYNWDEMAKDGYCWWKKRFQKMAEYFDAYRIDHVLGFFRIWEIPLHSVTGLLGQFAPALPMSKDEIKSFGFDFKPEHLKPYITESLLDELFGQKKEEAIKLYLQTAENGFFEMKPIFDTQKKVEKYFEGTKDKESQSIKAKLYSLISNVLFVADRTNPELMHPRISALKASCFAALDESQKQAYTNLYNHYFYQRHNDFWHKSAMAKLPPLLSATRMLACAEDLGMIPACVPQVMETLQMLSLEVQRMPKQLGRTFADTKAYPYLSVCTPSTHDMSTLRGWWLEDYSQSQKFYNEVLGKTGQAPKDATPEICEDIIKQNLNSHSMLCLLSFQDWLSLDGKRRNPDIQSERINIPANPRHYWRYRMHLNLESLISDGELNNKLRSLTKQSGR